MVLLFPQRIFSTEDPPPVNISGSIGTAKMGLRFGGYLTWWKIKKKPLMAEYQRLLLRYAFLCFKNTRPLNERKRWSFSSACSNDIIVRIFSFFAGTKKLLLFSPSPHHAATPHPRWAWLSTHYSTRTSPNRKSPGTTGTAISKSNTAWASSVL